MLVASYAVVCLTAAVVRADTTYSYDAGNGYAASARFFIDTTDSTKLDVIVTNTALNAPSDNAHVLTAIYFNGSAASSANLILGAGTPVDPTGTLTNEQVGNGWAYDGSHTFDNNLYTNSIRGAGFLVAPPPDDRYFTSNGSTNLGNGLDGTGYGIVASNVTSVNGNNAGPFFNNFIEFQINLNGSTINPDNLGSVVFQYGSDYTENHFYGVPDGPGDGTPGSLSTPEPSRLVGLFGLAGMALVGFVYSRRCCTPATFS
jgi:hypothetical protein